MTCATKKINILLVCLDWQCKHEIDVVQFQTNFCRLWAWCCARLLGYVPTTHLGTWGAFPQRSCQSQPNGVQLGEGSRGSGGQTSILISFSRIKALILIAVWHSVLPCQKIKLEQNIFVTEGNITSFCTFFPIFY